MIGLNKFFQISKLLLIQFSLKMATIQAIPAICFPRMKLGIK